MTDDPDDQKHGQHDHEESESESGAVPVGRVASVCSFLHLRRYCAGRWRKPDE